MSDYRQPKDEYFDALGEIIEKHGVGPGRGCNLCKEKKEERYEKFKNFTI